MTDRTTSEAVLEEAALAWFQEVGYVVRSGANISPDGGTPLRHSYEDVVLEPRLRAAVARINRHLPASVTDEVVRTVLRPPDADLRRNNHWFDGLLRNGVEVEYEEIGGEVRGGRAALVNYADPYDNDFLVVSQPLVKAGDSVRRPDLVVYVNGIPIVVIELKDPADERAGSQQAILQLNEYFAAVPSLFVYNAFLVVSDGDSTRLGTITSGFDRFLPWRSMHPNESGGSPLLEVLIRELLEPTSLVSYLKSCLLVEVDERSGEITKKAAGYHQFRAVRQASAAVKRALRPAGDGRGGVVWHTQGSGKSLTMLMLSGSLIDDLKLENPTIVVVTDRNDLDGQLYATFASGRSLLRQSPEQATSRADLAKRLDRASGGVIFTTIQKFEERAGAISTRANVVVLADEAHRSQYGFLEGGARWMREALPMATFVGFTGTPLELEDRSTGAVFGDYVDSYDIQQAINDHSTVPIYYEMRLITLLSDEEGIESAEEMLRAAKAADVRGEALDEHVRIPLERLVGSQKRLRDVAREVVDHFEKRREAIEGKAMLVCMSRNICMDLYEEIIKLRPAWHDADDRGGFVKVVISGGPTEGERVALHARTPARREALALRFKDPDDDFRLAIVCDMWLTGFDCPPLHTLYLDKPLSGHNLMQAIARVNRVFGDKPGGVIVDFLGIADQLRDAVAAYTVAGGAGTPVLGVQAEAVPIMLRDYESLRDFFSGLDYRGFFSGQATEQIRAVTGGVEYVLGQEHGKQRFASLVATLSKAFALAVPLPETAEVRDELVYFQTIRAAMAKRLDYGNANPPADTSVAVRQVISGAIDTGGVIDLFEAAGLPQTEISVLSDDFLQRMGEIPQKNLALEALRKLLNDQIAIRERVNLVQSRTFRESLETVLRQYTNRAISTAQVVDELVALAKLIRNAVQRGEISGLNQDELAFYDALADSASARDVMADETLRLIARELAQRIREKSTLDWTRRESVRADMRRTVRRLLAKHGYPPDAQEEATDLVVRQAEVMAEGVIAT